MEPERPRLYGDLSRFKTITTSIEPNEKSLGNQAFFIKTSHSLIIVSLGNRELESWHA